MDADRILRKIDFNYTRNDFSAFEIDLVMFVHLAPENNLVHQNDFSCDRNHFVAVEMNLSLMPFGRR